MPILPFDKLRAGWLRMTWWRSFELEAMNIQVENEA